MLKGRERQIVLALFLLVSILMVFDVLDDVKDGASFEHIAEELGIVTLSSIGFAWLWISNLKSRRENKIIRDDLSRARTDLEHYKGETRHLWEGLSLKVDEQLDRWGLTKSEKEVALLLLKGLSTKEIAEIRETSEKTISQQASSIYHKAKIQGRVELSAYFLEDLFIPR